MQKELRRTAISLCLGMMGLLLPSLSPAAPILHYRFNVTDDLWAMNEFAENHNGQLVGSPLYVDGFEQTSLELTNHGQYIKAPEDLTANLTSFTYMSWVKLETLKKSTRFFDWGSGINGDNAFIAMIPSYGSDNGVMALRFRSANGQIAMAFSNKRCPVGVWTHIALSYVWNETTETGTATFFINGEEAGSTNNLPHRPDDFLGTTTDNYFGYSRYETDTNGFGGMVDEIKLFSTPLSKEDIQKEAGLEGRAGALLIHHNFSSNQADDEIMDASIFKLKATLKNDANIITLGDNESGYINVLNLGENNGYLDLGAAAGSMLAQCQDYTLSAFFRVDNTYTRIQQNGNYLWTFSNSVNMTNDQNGYLAADLKNQEQAISPKSNTTASGLQKVTFGQEALLGGWHHMTYTQNGQTGTLFIDGVKVAQESISNTIASSLLKNTPTGPLYNWLGRSCFFTDGYLGSTFIYDFRLYRKALTEAEIVKDELKVEETIALLERATAANIATEQIAESSNLFTKSKPFASHLITTKTDNTEHPTPLAELNTLTFTPNSMLLNTINGTSKEILLGEVQKLTFAGVTTSIQLPTANQSLQLHPNPAQLYFTLSPIPDSGLAVKIYNISGQLVGQQLLSADNMTVNISSLPAGWYLIQTKLANFKLLKN